MNNNPALEHKELSRRRYAIYVRNACFEASDNWSYNRASEQIGRANSLVAQLYGNNGRCVRIFHDVGAGKPACSGWRDLLKLARKKAIDMVVVSSRDRLSRNHEDCAAMLAQLSRYSIVVISAEVISPVQQWTIEGARTQQALTVGQLQQMAVVSPISSYLTSDAR